MALELAGYEPVGCHDAEEGYDALYSGEHVDAIVTDIMMSGTDGFAFAENIRRLDQEIPIMFMTARDDLASKKRGFRAGVDDYMVKPVDLDELVLRVGALLRRAGIRAESRLVAGSLRLDTEEHTAYVHEEEVPLTVREFDILFKLLSNPRKTFTRAQLMDEFWDSASSSGMRTVDVYMTKLREKFAGCADFEIVTVHGLGYKAVIHAQDGAD